VKIIDFMVRMWPALHEQLFTRPGEADLVNTVSEALREESFPRRLRFVARAARAVEKLRRWGSGCPCHEEYLRRGEVVVCPHKGRRLRETLARLQSFADDLQVEVDRFDLLRDCAGDVALHQDAATTFLYIRGFCMQKFGFLKVIPYAFGQKPSLEVARNCLAQYDSEPNESRHHRVSQRLSVRNDMLAAFTAMWCPAVACFNNKTCVYSGCTIIILPVKR